MLPPIISQFIIHTRSISPSTDTGTTSFRLPLFFGTRATCSIPHNHHATSSTDSYTLSSLIVLFPSLATAISLDCSDIRVDYTPFNLKALGGPHELHRIKEHPRTITDTTITLDICQPLKKSPGIPKDEDCPNGSRGKHLVRSDTPTPKSWNQPRLTSIFQQFAR